MLTVVALLYGCHVATLPPRPMKGPAGKPHVLMVLADDLGWANVGWNRAVPTKEVQTPVLDQLVATGIELQQFYAFKYCSPTRSALQSGRSPIHVNVENIPNTIHNPNASHTAGYAGVALNFTTLPAKMRRAGYVPHAVGKWHAGMASHHQTPAGRGYESWLGYFGACNDYWSEIDKCGASFCGQTQMVDLWEQDRGKPASDPAQAPYFSEPARGRNNSQTCSQTSQHEGCRFEDDLLLSQAKAVVTAHSALGTVAPLFLFWATHAVHGPREVPDATLTKFDFIDWQPRRTYHALTNYLDGMVGEMVTTLKNEAMWANTLMVFCSDNGGDDQANNYPRRGAKFSNWQGGVHVAAFVSGGFLPPSRRGIKLAGLATVWDLYSTFGVVAGLSETEAREDAAAEAAGLPAVDSISQWDYWLGNENAPGEAGPPRTEVALGGEVGDENGGPSGVRFTGPAATNAGVEAVISVEPVPGEAPGTTALFKYMLGTFHFAAWTGPEYPNKSSTSFSANNSFWAVTANCSAGCLYDLNADPNEHVDVASTHPKMVAKLHSRLLAINSSVFSPARGTPDPRGCVVALGTYGGFWGPFLP